MVGIYKRISYILAVLIFIGCAGAPPQKTQISLNPTNANKDMPATTQVAAPTTPTTETVKADAQKEIPAILPDKNVTELHKHKFPQGGVAPEIAIGWLKNGNSRFTKPAKLRKDGQAETDRMRLANGQKPHTIVLSCSDSRVPPEIVFDQKLGEIFTVRTAGESLDSAVIGTIEYAIEHLGTRLILVMGHESCGAVQAAVNTTPGASVGTPDLDKMIAEIQPRIANVMRATPSHNLAEEGAANAKGVASDLIKRSSLIRQAVEEGQVKIQSALYHLESGKVDLINYN